VRTEPDVGYTHDAALLEIEVRTSTDGHIVQLSGELDLATASQLSDSVDGLTLDGSRPVVLDLARLTLCDAAGISAVLRTHRFVTATGGCLVICGASGLVRRVFNVTGVDTALDFH